MSSADGSVRPTGGVGARVGYVVKRYPRYSETFIVTEILAHERAGLAVEIFALLPCTDAHFQDTISRVRAPVTYLGLENLKLGGFWQALQTTIKESAANPETALFALEREDYRHVYQAMLLARAIWRTGISHLHAHFATSATGVARMASCLTGVPFTFTAHAKDIFHEGVDPWDLRRKLREANAVVTVSDHNLRYLNDHYGSDAARVCRIYNGLDLRQFPFTAPEKRPPLIVSVGRLVEKKGMDVLIAACAELRSRGVPFRCQIIGDGELAPRLRQKVAELRLESIVDLAGPRPQREVFDTIHQAAAFAAPCVIGGDSNRDGLPTVLLEAMALGTPCVSTDVTGIPEAIVDGQTGLCVPQHDPTALAAALHRLLGDATLRSSLASRARKLVEDRFDSDINAAAIRALFSGARPTTAAGESARSKGAA